jgi:hypothetical protein
MYLIKTMRPEQLLKVGEKFWVRLIHFCQQRGIKRESKDAKG